MPGVCPRCSRNVYFAEEKLALGKVWHILCFSCCSCRKLLDSCTVITNEGELFCKKCCPKPSPTREQFWHSKKRETSYCCCSGEDIGDNPNWRLKFENYETRKSTDDEETNCSSRCSIASLGEPSHYSQNSTHSKRLEIQNEHHEVSGNFENLTEIQNIASNVRSLLPEIQYEGEESPSCQKNISNTRRVSFHYKEGEIMKNELKDDFIEPSIIIEKSVNCGGERLRGGSGCCCSRESQNSNSKIENHGCCLKLQRGCRPTSCKTHSNSDETACSSEPQGCGNGGPCGGGCRGNCGKPGQTCLPSKTCSTPPSSCRKPSLYIPILPENFRCRNGSRSPCTANKGRREIHEQESECGRECRPKPPVGCECLGGGLDCQRCGRKVYHAEMQIISGVPYHNICFSCYCCRKPLETLTYHENCGEIYCKQCYVRNFGPQGYGYSGVLQTPM